MTIPRKRLDKNSRLKKCAEVIEEKGGHIITTSPVGYADVVEYYCFLDHHARTRAEHLLREKHVWCATCRNMRRYTERRVRMILEHLTGTSWPETSHPILRKGTFPWGAARAPRQHGQLRIDFYNARRRVAIEHDGWEHLHDPDTMFRDAVKNHKLRAAGITVHRMPYQKDESDVALVERVRGIVMRLPLGASAHRRARSASAAAIVPLLASADDLPDRTYEARFKSYLSAFPRIKRLSPFVMPTRKVSFRCEHQRHTPKEFDQTPAKLLERQTQHATPCPSCNKALEGSAKRKRKLAMHLTACGLMLRDPQQHIDQNQTRYAVKCRSKGHVFTVRYQYLVIFMSARRALVSGAFCPWCSPNSRKMGRGLDFHGKTWTRTRWKKEQSERAQQARAGLHQG